MKLGWVLEDTKYPEEKINNRVKLVPPQQQQQLSKLYDLRSAGKKMLEGERGGVPLAGLMRSPSSQRRENTVSRKKESEKDLERAIVAFFSVFFFFCGNFREKSEGIIFLSVFKVCARIIARSNEKCVWEGTTLASMYRLLSYHFNAGHSGDLVVYLPPGVET